MNGIDKKNDNFKIRSKEESDLSYIFGTWLPSYRYGSKWISSQIEKNNYETTYREVINKLLARSKTIVACKTDDPNVIFGYMVFEPDTLHYCFIKETFRRFGIATALHNYAFDKEPRIITHWTEEASKIEKLDLRNKHNPFSLIL